MIHYPTPLGGGSTFGWTFFRSNLWLEGLPPPPNRGTYCLSEHISTIFSKIEQKLTDLWFFFVAPNFIANCLNFMISNLFLEISLRKKLWIDFQNIGINLFINLYTFWIVYQKYPLRGGKGQKIWKTPFFHKSPAIGSPCAPPLYGTWMNLWGMYM